MKLPLLIVLLVFILWSKADNDSTTLSSTNDGQKSTITIKRTSNASSSAKREDLKAAKSSVKEPNTDIARLLDVSRMKFKEGSALKTQPNADDNLEILLPDANGVKLRYAALIEDTNEKKDDGQNSNEDDASSKERNTGPPRIFSNPKFKQIFGKNAGNDDKVTNPDVIRTFYPRISPEDQQDNKIEPPVLTLGGYQRPSKREGSSNIDQQRTIRNKPQYIPQGNEEIVSDNIYQPRLEAPLQQRFFPQPNVRYSPNVHDHFQLPQANYHYPPSDTISAGGGSRGEGDDASYRYADFSQNNFYNQQLNGNGPLNHHSTLRNNDIRAFPPIMTDYGNNFSPRLPSSTNNFPIFTATDNRYVFRTDTPLSVRRDMPSPSDLYEGNSYPMFANPRGDVVMPRSPESHSFAGYSGQSPFGYQASHGQSLVYPGNSMTPHGQVNVAPNNFDNSFPSSFFSAFAPPPAYLVNRQSPIPNFNPRTEVTEREDGLRTLGNGEQKLESMKNEKDVDPKIGNENSYLNYPTKQAGYATQEQLPSQNKSSGLENESDDSKKVKIGSTGSLGQFPTRYFVIGSPGGRHGFNYFPGTPFAKDNNASSFPSSAEEKSFNTTNNNSFNVEDFYKNLNVPINFNHPPHVASEKGLFFPYPQNLQNSIKSPIFPPSSPYFSRTPNEHLTRYPSRTRLPQSSYDFFNNYGNENIVDDQQTPKCAKDLNITICFEDPDYPRNDILHSLDSEALLLLRLIPPPISDELAGPKSENKEVNEDENTNICASDVKRGRPLRAINAQGKWKVIVNLEDPTGRFNQNIFTETCRDVGQSCSYTEQSVSSRCVQKHNLHRLFVWNRARGLHSDIFKLPMSCSCQIGKIRK